MTVTTSDPLAGHHPPAALTIDEAHAAMQRHLGCDTSDCAVRQTALATLVAAGHYQLAPDPGRSRPVTAHTDDFHRDRT